MLTAAVGFAKVPVQSDFVGGGGGGGGPGLVSLASSANGP